MFRSFKKSKSHEICEFFKTKFKASHKGPSRCRYRGKTLEKKLVKLANKPLESGRNLDIHKTFRRRPGRLLNV